MYYVRLYIVIRFLIIQFMWHVSWLSLKFPVFVCNTLNNGVSVVVAVVSSSSFDVYGNFKFTFLFIINLSFYRCSSFLVRKAKRYCTIDRDSWVKLSWFRSKGVTKYITHTHARTQIYDLYSLIFKCLRNYACKDKRLNILHTVLLNRLLMLSTFPNAFQLAMGTIL